MSTEAPEILFSDYPKTLKLPTVGFHAELSPDVVKHKISKRMTDDATLLQKAVDLSHRARQIGTVHQRYSRQCGIKGPILYVTVIAMRPYLRLDTERTPYPREPGLVESQRLR